jgi:hypothetical protein
MALGDIIIKYVQHKGEVKASVVGAYAKKKGYKPSTLRLIGMEIGSSLKVEDGKLKV